MIAETTITVRVHVEGLDDLREALALMRELNELKEQVEPTEQTQPTWTYPCAACQPVPLTYSLISDSSCTAVGI